MLYPILACVNLVVMIGSFAINGLAGSGPDGTLFHNTTGELSDYFYLNITPAGWTFSIWGFIYTWQAIWVLYSVVNICRKGHASNPAYTDPVFLPPVVLALTTLNSCLGVAWLISFDRLEVEVSFVMLILYVAGVAAALVFSYRGLNSASPSLVRQGRTREIWLTRIFVHNGLAIQGTWVSIASLLNLAMVLIYSGDGVLNVEDAGTVSLSILTVLIIGISLSDVFLQDRWSRYTLTPYAVFIVALSGSISKNYEEGARNSIFTVVMLVLAVVFAIVKITVTIYRHLKYPRYPTAQDEAEKTTLGTYVKSSGRLA